jgi:hypothetical protein
MLTSGGAGRAISRSSLKRQQRTFAAAGVEPKQLEGRRIRVRGWIEQRGGPVVMAEAPEQIELID